jgi:peptidoglycan/LPS O-acetylase OafA/YrhL
MPDDPGRPSHAKVRRIWIVLAIAFALSLTLTTIYSVREDEGVQWSSTLNMAGMLALSLGFIVPPERRPARGALLAAALACIVAAFVLILRGHLR